MKDTLRQEVSRIIDGTVDFCCDQQGRDMNGHELIDYDDAKAMLLKLIDQQRREAVEEALTRAGEQGLLWEYNSDQATENILSAMFPNPQ